MDEVPPILIADDELLVRLSMAEALQEGGYTILEAGDGASAIALIDRCEELRALVTDVRLGAGPDGWAVAHHARQKFASLAVVYVTGDSITDWSAEGVPQSAVLQKPFASAELVSAVANLLVTQQPFPPTA
jgi:CheY-like chemotaxis protein